MLFSGQQPPDSNSREDHYEHGSGEADDGDRQALFGAGGLEEEGAEASGSGANLFPAGRLSEDVQASSPRPGTERPGVGSRSDEGESRH